jgi:16S rRNA (cytosine1402-N4)-methyltransferase
MERVHAVLLDVGVSTEQLEDPKRGFSFRFDGPLDMRMDEQAKETAADVIANSNEQELIDIFRRFGEERYARPIARAIVRARPRTPIKTTAALRELIEHATPVRCRFGRIHPATRVFQALRIAVNDELEALAEALPKAFDCLNEDGRLAVISFHSLEDRIVKRFFVSQKESGRGRIVTRKPVRPGELEMAENPRARSAKLRVIERSKL